MKNTQPPIDLQKTIELQTELWRLFDEDFKKTTISDLKKIEAFNKRVYSKETGIPAGTPMREVERILQTWYELLTKVPKFDEADRPNDVPVKTTWNKDESAQFQEEARIRNEQIAATRENQTKLVEDFIRQNEERIAKAKILQEKLKDKVVYAKVVIPESEKLSQDEQKELEVLVKKAKNDTPVAGKILTPKQELIEDFTLEIEKKLEPVLKDLPEKEKKIIARTYAVEIVEKIANPEVVVEEKVQSVILDNIAKPKQEAVIKILQKDDELITLAKNGAVLIATKQKDDFSNLETITVNLVGQKIASKILGSQNYQVTFSEIQVQGETTHTVRFGELNQNQIQLLTQENSVLTTLQQHGQQFGYDKINSVFTNYAGTFLKGKVESLPAGSVIKKTYKDPIIQSIFARYGMAEPVIWQAVGQSSQFVRFAMKVAPDTAGPVLGLVSKITGKQLVTPIATKVAGQAAGKTVAGKVAGQVAAKAGLSAFIASLGIPIPGVNVIIGAIAWVGTELLSKAKVLWQKHKEKIKPILAGLVTLGAIRFLGVGPGLGVGAVATFGLMGTAGVATIATGAFGVLGLIGRSIGIAVATPVIVTLLVIPPLVAFIMLVINNSAYVVPPSPYSSSLNGGTDNPYMLVTKVASPNKLDNPTSPQQVIYAVSIKALKESLFNVKITSVKCTVIKKDGRKMVCPDEDVPPLEEGKSISPTQVHAFSFISRYDSRFSDSLVIDLVEVTAETADGTTVTTSGSASICIGECPKNCAQVSPNGDQWPTKLAENVDRAIEDLSQYQGFTAKLCPENKPINLCYKPSKINKGNFAWHVSNYYGDDCDIYFNDKGIRNQKDALFMITHELTHHIQAISSEHELSYSISGGWIPEILGKGGICTYSATIPSKPEKILEAMREAMAEVAALYTNSSPSWDACATNFSSKYPKNYVWAKKFMEE